MTIKLIFQMACILHPEFNFLHGYCWCQLPEQTVDMGSESKDHARYSHIQKRQDIPGYQLQPLENKAPSLPLPHPEDENIPRIGRNTWSQV